jgi:hypothetical protein
MSKLKSREIQPVDSAPALPEELERDKLPIVKRLGVPRDISESKDSR